MKKTCLLILVFIMLLSYTACSTETSSHDEMLDQFTNGDLSNVSGNRRLFAINSYSEYLDFLKKHEIPETFIRYDQIKELGSFWWLGSSDLSFGKSKDNFKSYYYFLKDDNGESVRVTVFSNDWYKETLENFCFEGKRSEESNPSDIVYMPIYSNDFDSSDLRVCKVERNKDDSQIIIPVYQKQIGNTKYFYSYTAYGDLNYIFIDCNGFGIELTGSSVLEKYPTDKKQTVMSKLLNSSTAEKEAEQIASKIVAEKE